MGDSLGGVTTRSELSTARNKQKASTPKNNMQINKASKSMSMGCKNGDSIASISAFVITTSIFIWLTALIEDTLVFRKTYGVIDFSTKFEKIGMAIPSEGRWAFYTDILSRAVCSSEIAFLQAVIFYVVVYSGISLGLKILGSLSTGNTLPSTHRTSSIMAFAMICLPAFGILSTVVGVLSADDISREEAKVLIFGPSGIGIIGFLMATLFNFMADYINAK
jgi:hypothetical protein